MTNSLVTDSCSMLQSDTGGPRLMLHAAYEILPGKLPAVTKLGPKSSMHQRKYASPCAVRPVASVQTRLSRGQMARLQSLQ